MSSLSLASQIAMLGGVGRSRFAPGTLATLLVGVPVGLVLGFLPLPVAMVLLAFIFFLSCHVSGLAERELGTKDPQAVVIDELVGYLVTILGLEITPKSILLGFLTFRLFDIWKPWPVNVLQERLKGGFAVVMDDVGAGIYAHALTWIILRLWS